MVLSFTVLFTNGNTTLASDIFNPRTYFKDDHFVVSWNDTSVGDVDIEIINEASCEILDRQRVKGHYYECLIM